MRHCWILLAISLALVFAACSPATCADPESGAEPPSKTVVVPTSALPREVREYKIAFDIRGKNPGNWLVDTAVNYHVRHSYGRREGDGLLPMEISMLRGQMSVREQKIDIAPGVYPKLTVLLDRAWQISDIFGAESRTVQGTHGLNYGNLIVVFYLLGGEKPHTVGEQWQSRAKLASIGEAFDITNKIESVETVGGVEAAKVTQQILPAADGAAASKSKMKCSTTSVFATRDGKLLKSHIECELELPSPSSPPGAAPPVPAVVKIDIVLADTP